MKKRKNQKAKAIKQQKNTLLPAFDTALPTSLKNKGIPQQKKTHIQLQTSGKGRLSPYIIELSRKESPSKILETKKQDLQTLARQLAQSHEQKGALIETDNTLPVELSLSHEEFQQQAKENERFLQKIQARTIQKYGKVCELPTPCKPLDESVVGIEQCSLDDILIESKTEKTIQNTHQKNVAPVKKERIGFLQVFSHAHILLPKQARHRTIAIFIALSFVLVMPLHAMQGLINSTQTKEEMEQIGEKALYEIQQATSSAQQKNFQTASLDFQRASETFKQAQESLSGLHLVAAALVNIIPQTDKTKETVEGLVYAGADLSQAAAYMSTAIDQLTTNQSYNIATKLELLTTHVQAAFPFVANASISLEQVDLNYIPEEQSQHIAMLLEKTPSLEQCLAEFLSYSQTLQLLLGSEQKMRYLVAFQNNTELRATGGFIGSFAQIDMLNGEITSIEIPKGGTYDVQGQNTAYIVPPEPLTLLNSRWELQDANWFPDFPSSSKTLLNFYEYAGGPTLDGVIAINATMLPKILEITGPIEMPEYNRTITAENVLFETQKLVEFEYIDYQEGEKETPKAFIGDLAPKLLEHLSAAEPQELLEIIELLHTSLTQKDALVYMQDNDLQKSLQQLGWTGELKQTEKDYLMVVNTNLGGGKTDTVVKQDIDVLVDIQSDGSIINTVTITKKHTGMSNALFEGVNNVDYIRLYIPQGSQLLDADGFEIPDESLFESSDIELKPDENMLLWTDDFAKEVHSQTDIWTEQGKTVFGNWMQTKPGEIETVTFTYKLPFVFSQEEPSLWQAASSYFGIERMQTYSLLLQKQPGVETRETTVRLSKPTNQTMIWSSHEDFASSGVSTTNEQDVFFSALFE